MTEAVKQQLRMATRAQPGRLYCMWGTKKSPEATQSAMSPRNTSTVSPTPSPSIYQCPENSSAVKSAALPQSRDHGNALIYPHYVPLLKIKRQRVFCPSSFTFSPCDWSCQCFVRLLWKHVRLEWLRLYVCARNSWPRGGTTRVQGLFQ